MTLSVEWDPTVRSMDDSIEKLLPLPGAPSSPEVQGAEVAVKVAEAKLNETEEREKAKEIEEEMPPQATTGSQIQGMNNEDSGPPTAQPGTEASPPILNMSKTYFRDNFGVEGGELIVLLEKGGEEAIIPPILELLRAEQRSILKEFDWWDDADWDILRLQDNDFSLLVMHPQRLELSLRKTIAGVKRAKSEGEKDEIWKSWHHRLNAENRLSRRERSLLDSCYNTIRKHGDMNAQTITSYGVNATTQEVASLIKSYGYLFDLKVVGRGQKADDRTYYYGTTKPPIFLKAIDSFIGNLWEVGGELEITKSGRIRLFLPFTTKRAEDYTVVLKAELGVEGLVWEGRQFVFDGDFAVKKAAEVALPFLDEKRQDACLVLAALDGNENAGKVLAYQKAEPQDQMDMLKEWNISEEGMDGWIGVIVDGF